MTARCGGKRKTVGCLIDGKLSRLLVQLPEKGNREKIRGER